MKIHLRWGVIAKLQSSLPACTRSPYMKGRIVPLEEFEKLPEDHKCKRCEQVLKKLRRQHKYHEN